MNTTLTMPARSLYWAVLTLPPGAVSTAPGVQIVRHTRELDELFEALVPVPFESVKPAYVALDAVRVVAVAADRAQLAAVCGAETTVATPDSLPGEVEAEAADVTLAALNLLWGDLEARPVVTARRRVTITAAAVILAVAGLALIGLERRTAALRSAAESEEAATVKLLTEMYRKPTREAGLAALDQELSRLTRTRRGTGRELAASDAADALQCVLSAWPRPAPSAAGTPPAAKLRTDSLSATADVVTLSVAVEQREQAETLSAAMRAIAGWRLPQPQFAASSQMNAGGGGVLTLRLSSDPARTPPSTTKPGSGPGERETSP